MPKHDFNKVAATSLKWHECSPVNLLPILRTPQDDRLCNYCRSKLSQMFYSNASERE